MERLVSGVTDVGTAVKESSERLGVGTTWLQEWIEIGRHFGVGNDAMVDGLKELGLRADEFIMTAGGPAAEAFQRLGIGPEELRKTNGRTDALFDLVLSRLREVDNYAARQRLADEIFGGTGGEQMAEMISATREELEALARAANERGAILTPEEIEAARQYTREMDQLKQSLFGIQTTVVSELLPAINDWLDRMGQLTQANREAVASDIVAGIMEVVRAAQMVGAAIAWAANLVGGFGNLLVIIAGILTGRFLLSLGMTIVRLGLFAMAVGGIALRSILMMGGGLLKGAAWLMSFGRAVVLTTVMNARMGVGLAGLAARAIPAAIAGIKALSIAFLTTPIGWITMGIAAVAGAVYVIYRNWEGIAQWFGNLWDGIKAFFSQGIVEITKDLLSFSPAALLLKGIDAVFEMFGARPLTDMGKEWIGGLWTGIEDRWSQMTTWLSNKMDVLIGWLPDWAKERLGIEGVGSLGSLSESSIGSAVPPVGSGSTFTPGNNRTDVSGELRIVIDSEGNPRVQQVRRDGALDFNVDSGLVGVIP
ncbi:MAG: hypothetical protein WD600_10770 [Pseudohongiella sp.]